MADRRGRVTESDAQWVRSRRQRLMRQPNPDERHAFADVPEGWCIRVVVVDHGWRADALASEGVLRWVVAAPTRDDLRRGLLLWSTRLMSTPEPDLGGVAMIRRLGVAE